MIINKYNSVIIGYGYLGKATSVAWDIPSYIDIGSINLEHIEKREDAKYYILCLPTPTEKGKQDIRIIEAWIKDISDISKQTKSKKTIIIRSTVLPGTCRRLKKEYGVDIIHIPEFFNEKTAIDDAMNPDLFVVGADDIVVRDKMVRSFRSNMITSIKKVVACDLNTAEMIKYSMNLFFSTKVILANQLWDFCSDNDCDYSQIKEALESHKWGSYNGWDVFSGGYRGAGGSCLKKDLEAFAKHSNLDLFKTLNSLNKELLQEKYA